MSYEQIEIEDRFEGKLKVIYLNQPHNYNSFTKQMLNEIYLCLEACNVDSRVRCVAITGKGDAFCAGQNLKEAIGLSENLHEERTVERMVVNYYNPLVRSIVKNTKPIIALVNGAAVGAGAMLALICDFALAKESSYLSQGFSKIGLIPDTAGTYFLPKLLGRQMANYLAFTGKKLYASEAKNLGLIAEVFKDEDFEDKANQILEQISNLPTKALSITKDAFNKSYINNLEDQLELESRAQQKAAETDDFKEGIAAFLEKRKPNYKGN